MSITGAAIDSASAPPVNEADPVTRVDVLCCVAGKCLQDKGAGRFRASERGLTTQFVDSYLELQRVLGLLDPDEGDKILSTGMALSRLIEYAEQGYSPCAVSKLRLVVVSAGLSLYPPTASDEPGFCQYGPHATMIASQGKGTKVVMVAEKGRDNGAIDLVEALALPNVRVLAYHPDWQVPWDRVLNEI